MDPLIRSVTLPTGVALDLGGIAKGYAADLVAEELIEGGAEGACVNVGGDLRVVGRPPGADAWCVVVDAEVPDATAPPALVLAAGAVATSSRARRTWARGDRQLHHLIDPRTGSPACTPWVAATVIAGRAVDAEPLAKAAVLARNEAFAAQMLSKHATCGLVVDDTGEWLELGDVRPFLTQ
jgi:FAD:protein FMN transferase